MVVPGLRWASLRDAGVDLPARDAGLATMAVALDEWHTRNRHCPRCGAPTVAVFGPTHPLRKCPPCARWAWADEDRYDPRYELFGRLPHGEWFGRLTVEDVLEHARPSPLAGRVGQAA